MRDNPDSFYNGALGSDILHALEKVNRKVTDEDVRKFMLNIRDHASMQISSNLNSFEITGNFWGRKTPVL